MTAYITVFQVVQLIMMIVLFVMTISALWLGIKALLIYIRKNS